MIKNKKMVSKFQNSKVKIFNSDVSGLYKKWPIPTVIISDGPYGVKGFPGDPPSYEELPSWYEPHIKEWSEKATPETTLWFWNTEIGWAVVHPILVQYGWKYVGAHTWDKGLGHIAGNVNTKSIRRIPTVTEICIQYVKEPIFTIEDREVSMKEWLFAEWKRTGLPFSKTNVASGVKDAATRKYFTQSYLWYFPPVEAFEKIVQYANAHGRKEGKPYFSINGKTSLTGKDWNRMRAKFKCPYGVTNVWREPPLNGKERLKYGLKSVHLNQKPLKLMDIMIESSSDKGDMVWEPFGGLCSGVLAAEKLGRRGVAAEIDKKIFDAAVKRFKTEG